MDIEKFLNLSTGKWFTQRTNYLLEAESTESYKADLSIELIAPNDSRIVQLCTANHIDPNLSLGGAWQTWDTSLDWGKPKQQGSALIVLIPDAPNSHTGKLLSSISDRTSSGTYMLGVDEALTLTTENKGIDIEERQWFVSDNLRMRTTIVKKGEQVIQTSFYSEIRKAVAKTPDK
jgi:hypothetical protein